MTIFNLVCFFALLVQCLCCYHTQFECDDGFCIPGWKLCDADYDCLDSSDEYRCYDPSCPPETFTCDNGNCISKYWECDDFDDCGDNSDEDHCSGPCSGDFFMCMNDSVCIPQYKECNGFPDCDDWSDEDHCETCLSHQFTCGNGHCIPGVGECDFYDSCGDKSDEQYCGNTTDYNCGPYQFSCSNGNCIPASWKCDGYDDCQDESDEPNDCFNYKPPNIFEFEVIDIRVVIIVIGVLSSIAGPLGIGCIIFCVLANRKHKQIRNVNAANLNATPNVNAYPRQAPMQSPSAPPPSVPTGTVHPPPYYPSQPAYSYNTPQTTFAHINTGSSVM